MENEPTNEAETPRIMELDEFGYKFLCLRVRNLYDGKIGGLALAREIRDSFRIDDNGREYTEGYFGTYQFDEEEYSLLMDNPTQEEIAQANRPQLNI